MLVLQRPSPRSLARRAESTPLRVVNSPAQRREKSTDPKDAATEEVNHDRERSLLRVSRPPEENRTRAFLQDGLDDARSEQDDAE